MHECPKTAKVFSPTVIVARKVALQQELSLFKNFKDIQYLNKMSAINTENFMLSKDIHN